MTEKSVAVVTGGGTGIGAACVRALSAAGFRVGIHYRSSRAGAEALLGAISDGFLLCGDLANVEDAEKMLQQVKTEAGRLDVLVNNAGTGTIGYMEQISDSEIDRAFGVNLTGVMRVTRACVPYLKKSGRGRIINMSSVEGIRGSAFLPVYCVTKSGVIGLTMANAMELAKFKITVNAICPGPIETDMLAPLISSDEFRQKMVKSVPLKRLGKPEDIAGAALFLASEDSSFITGHSLVVDGGMTIRN